MSRTCDALAEDPTLSNDSLSRCFLPWSIRGGLWIFGGTVISESDTRVSVGQCFGCCRSCRRWLGGGARISLRDIACLWKGQCRGMGNYLYITPCVKCGFTHASRAEIRIFTPRDIKFRTILVRKKFSWRVFDYITRLRLVLQTHTRPKKFCRTRIVMYYSTHLAQFNIPFRVLPDA